MRKKKDKQKAEEVEAPTQGETSATVLTLPPPAQYAGSPPAGMGEGPELEVWNKFVEKDFSAAQNPPADGGYMMYSGQALRDSSSRQPFKDLMEASGNGKLHDWADTYRGTEAFDMWADYQKANTKTQHIASYAMSWGQARRAANDKPDLAILFSSKDEPLMKENTYWGAVEAGIITGPDSKVDRIWRYNADEIGNDPPPDPVLVWDRSVHEPFGKTDNDWKKNPRDADVAENPLSEARPLGSTAPAGTPPPDVQTGTPPDVQTTTPPDVQTGTPPDVETTTPPDVQTGTPPDVTTPVEGA
jgi:hypothetical protein